MRYKVLPPARNDLDSIEDWVLASFGESAAVRAVDKLLDVFEMLAAFQHAGHERPDVFPPPMRFFSSWPNLVMYEPGSTLLIHRVFSARMDLQDF